MVGWVEREASRWGDAPIRLPSPFRCDTHSLILLLSLHPRFLYGILLLCPASGRNRSGAGSERGWHRVGTGPAPGLSRFGTGSKVGSERGRSRGTTIRLMAKKYDPRQHLPGIAACFNLAPQYDSAKHLNIFQIQHDPTWHLSMLQPDLSWHRPVFFPMIALCWVGDRWRRRRTRPRTVKAMTDRARR